MRYRIDELADTLHAILKQREEELRLEQAVRGLDALDELGVQALLAEGLAEAFEVAREVHYPSSVGKKLTGRPRCDLVLSPKGRPLRLDHRPATLFDPPEQCEAGDALWLEVKCAYQYREGGRSHGGYGAQWRQAVVKDLQKMQAESPLREAALVLVVFNASERILAKDLEHFEDTLAMKEVLAGFRQVRSLKITERIGHTLATVAVWSTVQVEAG